MSYKRYKVNSNIFNSSKNPTSLININSNSIKFLFNKNKLKLQTNNDLYSQENNKNAYTDRNYFTDEKNSINYDEKTTRNINLFGRIKKLLAEFQKENDEKNRLYKSKKNNKKRIPKKKLNKKKSKKFSTLLVPQKKVYYNMPKVRSKIQLNRYLINDFKEVDSDQDYIKRSLKYQKMNEELEEMVIMNHIKQAEKMGTSENFVNKYQTETEFFNNIPKCEVFDYEDDGGSSQNINILRANSKNNEENNLNIKNMDDKKKHSIFNNNNYNLSLRKLYMENNNIATMKYNSNKHKNVQKSFDSNQNNNVQNMEIKEGNKILKIPRINHLMDKKKTISIKRINALINPNKNIQNNYIPKIGEQNLKKIKKKKTKKENIPLDKFSLSNRIYKNQKLEYLKYLKNKFIMRGQNFSRQLAILFKDKEKFGIIENEEDEGEKKLKGHPKLDQTKLLYQMKLKNIFTNSFNSMRLLNEGDQDLDLDNLNKIKESIKKYEIEMTRIMKNSDNPKCIKNRFNKSTVGKFHSSRGIYM